MDKPVSCPWDSWMVVLILVTRFLKQPAVKLKIMTLGVMLSIYLIY